MSPPDDVTPPGDSSAPDRAPPLASAPTPADAPAPDVEPEPEGLGWLPIIFAILLVGMSVYAALDWLSTMKADAR